MNQWPKITVVTPSYNQAEFLERTIQSVLNQNYPNLEYIIIDGGSTDGSVEIIKKYQDKLSYWVSEKDRGQTHAINKGFRRAAGEIVAWLNSDDEYCPGALEAVARIFMADESLDFVFGDRLTIDVDGNVLHKNHHTRFTFTGLIVLGFVFSQPSCFWKRSLFEKYGYLDESKRFCMDYEFFCRIGQDMKAKHIRRFLSSFRFHSESKSINIGNVLRKEKEQIRGQYLKTVCKGFPLWLVVIAMHIYRAFCYTCQGDGFHVLRGIKRRLTPKSMRAYWFVNAP